MRTSSGFNRPDPTALCFLALVLVAGCGGGGGGSGTAAVSFLEVVPKLEFVASGPEGGPFGGEATYTVMNPGTEDINWSAAVDVKWISLSKASGVLTAGGQDQVTVSVEETAAKGLPAGQHKGMISFTDTDLRSVAYTTPAMLSVLVSELGVSPETEFLATGAEGGPFPASKTYTLQNDGGTAIDWTATSDVQWIALSRGSGTLDPGRQDAVLVSIDRTMAANLMAGQHKGQISFTDTDLGKTVFAASVTLSVLVNSLHVTPSTEFFANGPEGGPFPWQTEYTVHNAGTTTINWLVESDVDWIEFSKSSGTLTAGTQEAVTVSVRGSTATSLPAGEHTGAISFTDTDRSLLIFAQDAVLWVDHGPRIDNKAWLSMDGEPFFPIGVWNQRAIGNQVAHMKSLGINTYLINGSHPSEPSNPQLLTLLEANDMWGVLEFDSNVMDHPRLLGWLLPDEPDVSLVPPALMQSDYDAIKSIDPRHFVGMNLSSSLYWDDNFGSSSADGKYQGYTDVPDIVSFDMYPVTGWNQPTWAYIPGAIAGFMLDHYVAHEKPVWAIVEASRQRLSWTPPSTPGPTPRQMRFQVWDAIINGATAIHYFVSSFNPFEFVNLTPEIEQEMARTNGQIQALTSVILSVPPPVNVTSSEVAGLDHDFTVRQDGSTLYVFAANADMGYNPESITFTFEQELRSVTVYGEGWVVLPNGNTFTGDFEALEVHIYEVRF